MAKLSSPIFCFMSEMTSGVAVADNKMMGALGTRVLLTSATDK